MAADALAPANAMPTAVMVLTKYNQKAFVFHEKGLPLNCTYIPKSP